MANFYENEYTDSNPLVLVPSDEDDIMQEYNEEDGEYTDDDDGDDDDDDQEEDDEKDEKKVPDSQMVKPDFTWFWVAIMTASIFFSLMGLSTLYLSIHSWTVNDDVNSKIDTILANLNAENVATSCMTCTDNGDATFTTTIKGIMSYSPTPPSSSTQFSTGIILDGVSFAYGNEARSHQTFFLFENDLGSSNNLVSIGPGMINVPIVAPSLPDIGDCSSDSVFESAIHAQIDLSDNLFLCICNVTDDFCLPLVSS